MTMQDYSCYCTAEQTRRAYKLGAPLVFYGKFDDSIPNVIVTNEYGTEFRAAIPTTQQMINWLQEKGFWIYVKRYWQRDAFYACFEKQGLARIECTDDFEKPGQAELAAIDAALDYLEKGGKI